MDARLNRENGAVLVVVLWAIAVLTIALTGVLSSLSAHATLSRSLQRSLVAEMSARAGIEIAAGNLLTLNPERRWIGDGRSYSLKLGESQLQVRVWDVSALLDVNRADIALMTRVFRRFTPNAAAAEAAAMRVDKARGGVQWASLDVNAAVGFSPSTSRKVEPRRPFHSEGELTAILGYDPELLRGVLRTVTIYGRTGGLDPALAPRELLESVPDISSQEVNVILANRKNGRIASDDARSIVAKFATVFDTIPTDIYRIEVTGEGHILTTTIILDRDGGAPFHILSWKQQA